ncbi:MAG TPA: HAD family phosphatase [Marmoricola sp.]|nr:HAD family phosphatase [Marmoricola sp.]
MNLPAAVLFDMDGTLVDTERLWWEAVSVVADSIGRPLVAADVDAVTGRSVAYTADYLHATSDRPLSVESLVDCLERAFTAYVTDHIVPVPGAVELLDCLVDRGVPAAIVSASPRSVVDLVATNLGLHLFATTVAVEDTARTKPAPDPYELAASILGVDPRGCVAVEDTEIGAQAALAAGCRVLAVPSEGQRIAESSRLVVRKSLAELATHDLTALLGD